MDLGALAPRSSLLSPGSPRTLRTLISLPSNPSHSLHLQPGRRSNNNTPQCMSWETIRAIHCAAEPKLTPSARSPPFAERLMSLTPARPLWAPFAERLLALTPARPLLAAARRGGGWRSSRPMSLAPGGRCHRAIVSSQVSQIPSTHRANSHDSARPRARSWANRARARRRIRPTRFGSRAESSAQSSHPARLRLGKGGARSPRYPTHRAKFSFFAARLGSARCCQRSRRRSRTGGVCWTAAPVGCVVSQCGAAVGPCRV